MNPNQSLADPKRWDDRFSSGEFAYGSQPNDTVVSAAHYIPAGGRVLCLAEGEGRNAVYLATQGYRVTAVDFSAVGLEKCRSFAAEKGVEVETIVADLAQFPIQPDAWEGVVSIWAHVPSVIRTRLYTELKTGLAPGGVFILEAYTPRQITRGTGGPKDPDLLLTAGELSKTLAGLDIILLDEKVRRIEEGRFHTGDGDVVQLIARRPLG